MNETMTKFGYPDTRVKEYEGWIVLLRPQQVTLGSLVLAVTDRTTAFSRVSEESFGELRRAVADIETVLHRLFRYDRINYLMLMMVDPDVHFHVIPRYAASKRWEQMELKDYGWPGPPDLKRVNATTDETNRKLTAYLKQHWP